MVTEYNLIGVMPVSDFNTKAIKNLMILNEII